MSAYLIATVDVHDADGYAEYREKVPALIARHGGRYMIRGGASETLEGGWPDGRIVVLDFPDLAAARAFADDPDYDPVKAIRHRTGHSHIWIVDGVPGGPDFSGLHGYLLGTIRITDPDAYRTYAERVPGVLAAAGGVYLARGGEAEVVEGDAQLDRVVIVGFADITAARAFHDGAPYAPLLAIRSGASESNIVLVEGM